MSRLSVVLFIDEQVFPWWEQIAKICRARSMEELMARTLEQLAQAGEFFQRQVVTVCTMPVQPKPNDPAMVCGRRRPCPVHDVLLDSDRPTFAFHDARKGDDD